MTKEVINAFHPDYVKTHEPNFMSSIRTTNIKEVAGKSVSEFVTKRRKEKPSHGTVFGMSDKEVSIKPVGSLKKGKSMTMAEVTQELIDSLKIREYHTFSRAGVPAKKVKRKK